MLKARHTRHPAERRSLLTDLYQLTMAAAYFDNQRNVRATFEMFVRQLPNHRGYLIAAGLEQAVEHLSAFRFGDESISFLQQHPAFGNVSDAFFDCLSNVRFTGDVDAMPEGTVAFANEPIIRVNAPIIEAQLIETYLLAVVNFQTMVSTKASRVVAAARGRDVADFGARRAHGPEAGALAARAAYIGGCVATSNVLAGAEFGIPVVGTMAHSFITAFPTEAEAFEAYARVFPKHTTLLIDTYDTMAAARAATKFGKAIRAVRIDSGDLAAHSKAVRKELDDAGLRDARIVASSDLNEYRIRDLLQDGARIDLFGVGTEMVTSRDDPALSGVYKLVSYEDGDRVIPTAKESEGKLTYPYAKQVYRELGENGEFVSDCVALADEPQMGTPLLEPVMKGGNLVGSLPPLDAIQRRATEQLKRLPSRYKRLENPATYPVRFSDRLEASRAT